LKQRINYRAERAERTRKKAQKKEARLAALVKKSEENIETKKEPEDSGSTPNVHRNSD
jgi:hypothetical protein